MLIAGNWKMNGHRAQLAEVRAIDEGLEADDDALLCLPSTLLREAVASVERLRIGAQDCHANDSGAHTGDLSASMLADAGATHVIVGHSERRADHREDDAAVRAKAVAALEAGLTPIVCIGETESEREAGRALDVLTSQLGGSLPEHAGIVVAYEPVWAIGTGRTASEDDVAEAHAHVRAALRDTYGQDGAGVPILYGGSVKPGNAASLMRVPEVDGALVGGASLKASDFLAICAAAR